jgi:cobalt-zinc-cadmium efflux system membrane fusion protein
MSDTNAPAPSSTAAKPAGGRTALIFAAVAAVGAIAWFALRHEKPAAVAPGAPAVQVSGETVTIAPNAPQWTYVTMAKAEAGEPLKPLPVPGRVQFDENRSASVGVPLPGRVELVQVRFGDRVKKGQRLFSVRSGAFADMDRELASAREEVAVKQRVFDRLSDLVKLQAAAEKDRLAAEAELKEAQLQLKAAQAKQSSLSVSAEGDNLFWVTAPRDGTVVEHDVFGSQEVGPERDKPLLRISDLGEVLVIGDVAERDAADLKSGMVVEVRASLGSQARPGLLERVSEVVDPQRHTVEIRIRVKNDDRTLRPNGYVDVTLGVDTTARWVRVPSEAVVTEGEQSVVFVQRDAQTLVRVPVTLGRTRDGQVEIRSGLEAGTTYVSKGALLLLNQVDLAR